MHARQTSTAVKQVALTAAVQEILGPSKNRLAILLSAGATAYSVSFSPNPTLGSSTWNFLAGAQWIERIERYCIGTAINQPLYGIASGNVTIEITEILDDDVQTVDSLQPDAEDQIYDRGRNSGAARR